MAKTELIELEKSNVEACLHNLTETMPKKQRFTVEPRNVCVDYFWASVLATYYDNFFLFGPKVSI